MDSANTSDSGHFCWLGCLVRMCKPQCLQPIPSTIPATISSAISGLSLHGTARATNPSESISRFPANRYASNGCAAVWFTSCRLWPGPASDLPATKPAIHATGPAISATGPAIPATGPAVFREITKHLHILSINVHLFCSKTNAYVLRTVR